MMNFSNMKLTLLPKNRLHTSENMKGMVLMLNNHAVKQGIKWQLKFLIQVTTQLIRQVLDMLRLHH